MMQSPPPSLPSPADTFDAMEKDIKETVRVTTVPTLRTFTQPEHQDQLTLMSEEIASRVHDKLRAKFKPFRQRGRPKNFLPHVEDILVQMFPSIPHQLIKALRDRGWVDFSSIFNNMGSPNKLLAAFLAQHNCELLHHRCFLQLVFFSRHIRSLPTDTPDVTSAYTHSA